MTNDIKDNLFVLIKSLTKSEKRQFKLYVGRMDSNEDSKFLKLFSLLDKMNQYNEKLILDNKIVSKQQLSNLKAHLYKQILISLRLNPQHKNVKLHIRSQIDFATILYQKGLYKQSLKILDKVKSYALKYDEYTSAYEIVEFEKLIESLYVTRSLSNRTDELVNQTNYLKELNNISSSLSNISLQLYEKLIKAGYAKSDQESSEIKQIFTEKLKDYKPEDLGFREKLIYYQSHVWYSLLVQDFLSTYKYASKWIETFDKNPDMINIHPVYYLKGYNFLLESLSLIKYPSKFKSRLNDLLRVIDYDSFPLNQNLNALIFLYKYNNIFNLHVLEGTFKESLKIIPEVLVGIEKIKIKRKQIKPWESLIVSENLSWDEFLKINNYLYELVGVKPVMTISRDYPFSDIYTHVLGYVSQPNEEDILQNEVIQEKFVPGIKIGKLGLEKTLENDLIGVNDIQRYEVNAYGKRINQLEYQKGKQGSKIRITLDTEVQKLSAELLEGKAGSISVMDIYTGEMIAMYSSPSYNPNSFLFGISQDEWQLIRNNPLKPLINKTLSGLYSPGSTIKPIVALSALENGVIDTKFKVQCKGKMELYGQTFHCWKEKGHGFVSLKDAMKQSCDTYFYEVARKLGVDRLKITAEKFGLGNKVLGEYFENEKAGQFPDTKWKINELGKGWVLGETLITGIGQGYTQTTPIQLCLMTAQIANGGYKITPKILTDDNQLTSEQVKKAMQDSKLNNSYEPLYGDQRNIKIIQEVMFSSTNELRGTSYKSRIEDPKYQFAGKTGTAQVKRISKRERELDLKTSQIPYEERDHALYVAFGPYRNPRYAVSIIVEHGGSGSSAAAPMATKLFKLIVDRHQYRKQLPDFKEFNI